MNLKCDLRKDYQINQKTRETDKKDYNLKTKIIRIFREKIAEKLQNDGIFDENEVI